MTEVGIADFSVIKSGLDAAVREMSVNLRRSAFSSIVREMRDFAVAVTDTKGEVVAQAECIPIMTAGISLAFRAIGELGELDDLTPDDAFIMNDPYAGGQHLQDVYLFSPLFDSDGVHIGFAGNTAHHVDLGGAHAGLTANAKELFQEGIRFPMSRFSVSRDFDSPNGFVRRFIAANVRTPDSVLGDLRAQFAANNTAANRLREIVDKFGRAKVLAVMEHLKDYSDRRTRASIRRIPDGVYSATEVFQRGGDAAMVEIAVTVTVADDQLVVDFTGTGDQIDKPLNCPLASTISAAQSGVRCMLDDTDIDFNEGCNRALTFVVPHGSVLNPKFPAPVRSRLTPASRVFNGVVKALGQAMPKRAVATGFDTSTAVSLSSLKRDGAYEVVVELIGHGWGGCAEHSGADGLDNPISNCANAPIEALELDYSHFEIDEYSLRRDSAGAGRNRGGYGVRRTYRATRDGVQISGYSDRQMIGPDGIFGGGSGAPGSHLIKRADGSEERLPVMYERILNEGDQIVIETGGGGGYGEPTPV
ncbi:MAG: hydantoinase B/oxoprolinase family protein [Nocardioides sp.]|uniref:hydantoinase B/oxoprolinase family protein n=1 Tax=Nocardioides sp. TaxID=35761 RepID=UPI0039E39046